MDAQPYLHLAGRQSVGGGFTRQRAHPQRNAQGGARVCSGLGRSGYLFQGAPDSSCSTRNLQACNMQQTRGEVEGEECSVGIG
jgi:hypothetical protein